MSLREDRYNRVHIRVFLPVGYVAGVWYSLHRGWGVWPIGVALAGLVAGGLGAAWMLGNFLIARVRRATGLARQVACPNCKGTGRVPGLLWGTNPCDDCGGSGREWS